jgi:hypothetical protein
MPRHANFVPANVPFKTADFLNAHKTIKKDLLEGK